MSKNYEKALKAFGLAARTGDLNARTALGIMYIAGLGVIQNDTKGLNMSRVLQTNLIQTRNILYGLCIILVWG